ncbi:hypothetical protein B9Q10_01220 [Candidatus Marsarchaeota G2 archaeon ECH_B_SAG-E12]|jgi:tRNA(Arg) A34 adenosine deaminase TadA|uniref:CMP/dCMP-type deaminase domain-containing protein n=1 Tax=Candidatus Marsarchaeota G2 archaeon ECH_B_SAG-E12 TaxID=1978164 RepID=A0A2R6BV54_9ARCH|nr:MAG: hypothetical protein B9Q10_01220 [Candidatus Marsarchaeota G2 archaeon ECH_B_SAG-E12]
MKPKVISNVSCVKSKSFIHLFAYVSVSFLIMRKAVAEAKRGIKKGLAPFGAAIVKNGEVVTTAHNMVRSTNDPTAHAEIVAIRRACKKLKTFELKHCSIYSTCEPCLMCLSACFWANIREIVFGASVEDAKNHGIRQIDVDYKKAKELFGGFFVITPGVLKDECVALFEEWKKR